MAFTFPTTGTLGFTWVPQFASTDLAAADRSILSLNNAVLDLLSQSVAAATRIVSTDGTTPNGATMPAWAKDDAIEIFLDWNSTTNLYGLHYCNKSNGDLWTHITKVAFDGAFTKGTFLQLCKAASSANAIFRNLPVVFPNVFTDAEIEEMTA